MSTSILTDTNNKILTHADKVDIETEAKLDHIPDDQTQPILDTLKEFSHLFVSKESDLPANNLLKFQIDTGDNPPIKQSPHKVPLTYS